ncbi:unnamed protein product [Cuscuta epithymum]|uniref:Uncharacterized protein n=1 Tax=Cuscuta epithymum TaxID=186058 RepID=A0AAV0C5R4_9ASTE|nr:unnamed protein product [Cuscuta epithymum]
MSRKCSNLGLAIAIFLFQSSFITTAKIEKLRLENEDRLLYDGILRGIESGNQTDLDEASGMELRAPMSKKCSKGHIYGCRTIRVSGTRMMSVFLVFFAMSLISFPTLHFKLTNT